MYAGETGYPMEHCHSGKIPDRFDMVVVVAWTERMTLEKVVVVVGKSRKKPGVVIHVAR